MAVAGIRISMNTDFGPTITEIGKFFPPKQAAGVVAAAYPDGPASAGPERGCGPGQGSHRPAVPR